MDSIQTKGFQLTTRQIDLLHAAFLQHGDAITAWLRWRDGVDWNDELDGEEFALLPYVFRNLRALDFDDPLTPRLKGITRQAWLANRAWIQRIERSLTICAEKHIDLLLLLPTREVLVDSAAIKSRQSPLHIAVRFDHAEAAIELLFRLGWLCTSTQPPRWSLTGYTLGASCLSMRFRDGLELILVWNMKWWFGGEADNVWHRSRQTNIGSLPVNTLPETDYLEMALRQSDGVYGFGNLIEVLKIARSRRVDWTQLRERIRQYPAPSRSLSALRQLTSLTDQWAVPRDIVYWNNDERSHTASQATDVLTRRTIQGWETYRDALGAESSKRMMLLQLPGYLMGRWNIPRLREIPRGMINWIARG